MADQFLPWIYHDGGPDLIGVSLGDYLQAEALIYGEHQSREGPIVAEDLELDASDRSNSKLIRYRIRMHPDVAQLFERMGKQDA